MPVPEFLKLQAIPALGFAQNIIFHRVQADGHIGVGVLSVQQHLS
jgi:hypothetical protein